MAASADLDTSCAVSERVGPGRGILTAELEAAIRYRDELIAEIRNEEARLKPMIEEMWAANKHVEDLSARIESERC